MTAAQRLSTDRLIEAKGQAVTLTRHVEGAYNTATATASITTTTVTGKGVILPLGPGARYQAGTNVSANDKTAYLSAIAADGSVITTPKVGDTVTDAGGKVHEIVAVMEISPAGLDIVYGLTVRAAQ